MKILIDDQRQISDFPGCDDVVRGFDEGIAVLRSGLVDTLWLDSDLGEAFDRSGIDILRIAQKNDFLPDHICLVTGSNSARECMATMLDQYGYFQEQGNWFHKS